MEKEFNTSILQLVNILHNMKLDNALLVPTFDTQKRELEDKLRKIVDTFTIIENLQKSKPYKKKTVDDSNRKLFQLLKFNANLNNIEPNFVKKFDEKKLTIEKFNIENFKFDTKKKPKPKVLVFDELKITPLNAIKDEQFDFIITDDAIQQIETFLDPLDDDKKTKIKYAVQQVTDLMVTKGKQTSTLIIRPATLKKIVEYVKNFYAAKDKVWDTLITQLDPALTLINRKVLTNLKGGNSLIDTFYKDPPTLDKKYKKMYILLNEFKIYKNFVTNINETDEFEVKFPKSLFEIEEIKDKLKKTNKNLFQNRIVYYFLFKLEQKIIKDLSIHINKFFSESINISINIPDILNDNILELLLLCILYQSLNI